MYGQDVAEALHARLADLWAARNVAELPLWLPANEKANRFTVPVSQGTELVLESNHAADRTEKASIHWEKVSRVQLLEVKQSA
jgi:hypothetical protein